MLTEYTSQNPEDMKKLVSMGYLESIAVDNQSLVPETKLKSFFCHAKTFTDFKANYLQTIPDEYWINTLNENHGSCPIFVVIYPLPHPRPDLQAHEDVSR
ncbi:hypothetical protein TNCT_426751 [Trichonephila clavata]|uniref:Uncharacterized protein n=1 Tax=Trichonephila clavata TaxID=2740835 RepID=A0A8X6HH10_TRICU|nr:hypothetical protein TNCT_426751 [Trichonephila clavata]